MAVENVMPEILTPENLTPGILTPGNLTPGILTPGNLTPGRGARNLRRRKKNYCIYIGGEFAYKLYLWGKTKKHHF